MSYYIIAFCFFFFMERFFASTKQPLYHKQTFQNIFYTVVNKIYSTTLVFFFISWLTKGSPLTWEGFGPLARLSFPTQVFSALLLRDFVSYWIHRISHKKPLWFFHQIHHQAFPVDWLTTYRFHPINFLLYVMRIPFLFSMGLSFKAIVAYNFLLEFQNYLSHTNIDWKFGFLKKILVSPHFHRLHHEKDQIPGNSNFATIFSFWDVLFNTYYYTEDPPANPGLSYKYHENLKSQMIHPFKETFWELWKK